MKRPTTTTPTKHHRPSVLHPHAPSPPRHRRTTTTKHLKSIQYVLRTLCPCVDNYRLCLFALLLFCLITTLVYATAIYIAGFHDIWAFHDVPLRIRPTQYTCTVKEEAALDADHAAGPTAALAPTRPLLLLHHRHTHRHHDDDDDGNAPATTTPPPPLTASTAAPAPPLSRHPFTTLTTVPATTPLATVTFAVNSACSNARLRNTIRDTWARRATALSSHVLFFVGSHASCADAVAQEQRIYHDVVVLPVLESYDNLSKKTRAMLHYLQTTVTWRGGKRQPWSDYVAKVDDDVYIDVEAFLGRLHLYQGRKYLYLGEWWWGVGGGEGVGGVLGRGR